MNIKEWLSAIYFMRYKMHFFKRDFIMGFSFVFLIALFSQMLLSVPLFTHSGISSLIIAILVGMLIGNTCTLPSPWIHGIQFAAKRILRLAIILYGFRISVQELMNVGANALVISTLMVTIILSLGFFIGKKIIKLDGELSLLISAGAAICGAAAVLAVEDILKSQAHKTSVAIATVVIFGTLSMFIYPLLQQHGWLFDSAKQFGIFAGASIHEVAQVVVAGSNIDDLTSQIAVVVKMMRVILLVPVLLLLSFLNKKYNVSGHNKKMNIVIPWFALGFLLVIGLHSFFSINPSIVSWVNQFDTFLLTIAMGAIGLETKWAKIRHVGMKPFYLATILCICLCATSYLLVSTLIT